MRKTLLILTTLLTLGAVVSCGNNNSSSISSSETSIVSEEVSSSETKKVKEGVQLVGDKVLEYLNGSNIANFENVNDDKPKTHILKISDDSSKHYNLVLECNGVSTTLENVSNVVELTNLLIDSKYTWIATSDGSEIKGEFRTQNYGPRIMDVDGIPNVRDIGGYDINNGKMVQGLIYRGAELNNHYTISPKGLKTMNEYMMIKTDIDLRNLSEISGITASPLGESVTYLNLQGFGSYNNAIISSKYYEGYATFFKTLARPSSYPVYVHCYQGADRTGTVCELIEGLMGVSDEERVQDYEITTFSSGEDSYRDITKRNYPLIRKNIELLYPSDSYSESIKQWMINKLGLQESEVEAIKKILSGETKLDITTKIAEIVL